MNRITNPILVKSRFAKARHKKFIAEIKDCVPDVEIISSKGSDEHLSMENSEIQHDDNDAEKNTVSLTTNKQQVKAYPSVEVEDKITLEIEGLNDVVYAIVSLDGQVLLQDKLKNTSKSFTEIIPLPNMASGVYLLVLKSNNYSKTIKLLKR